MNIKAILKKPYVFLTMIYCSIYVIWSLANPITFVPVYIENGNIKFGELVVKGNKTVYLSLIHNEKVYGITCGINSVPETMCYQLSVGSKVIHADVFEMSSSCTQKKNKNNCTAIFINAKFMTSSHKLLEFNSTEKQVNNAIRHYSLYREFLLILFYVMNISILYLWRYYYVKK